MIFFRILMSSVVILKKLETITSQSLVEMVEIVVPDVCLVVCA